MWALIKWFKGGVAPNQYVEVSAENPLPVAVSAGSPVQMAGFDFANEATNDTVTLVTGAGLLHAVQVNTAGATSDITLYDSLAGSGTVIAVIDTTVAGYYQFDANLTTGLTYVTTGGTPANVTILYRE